MFGGLHLEIGMWKMLGHYLASSGWTIALTDAGIATAGTADSFLNASHLTRTRRAHQLTCVTLNTFQYWDTILNIEVLVLTIVRAHREKNFPLYVEALEGIVGFFLHLTVSTMQGGFLYTSVTCHHCQPLLKKNLRASW